MIIREKQLLPVFEKNPLFNLFVLEHQVEAREVSARMELPMGRAVPQVLERRETERERGYRKNTY